MSTPESILDAALELSEQERAKLAFRLMESLDEPADPNAEELWAREIARRVEALRSGRAETVPADEVHARIEARLAKRRG